MSDRSLLLVEGASKYLLKALLIGKLLRRKMHLSVRLSTLPVAPVLALTSQFLASSLPLLHGCAASSGDERGAAQEPPGIQPGTQLVRMAGAVVRGPSTEPS